MSFEVQILLALVNKSCKKSSDGGLFQHQTYDANLCKNDPEYTFNVSCK